MPPFSGSCEGFGKLAIAAPEARLAVLQVYTGNPALEAFFEREKLFAKQHPRCQRGIQA
jgi:hypothetical protein